MHPSCPAATGHVTADHQHNRACDSRSSAQQGM
jgi:hypothetical protein